MDQNKILSKKSFCQQNLGSGNFVSKTFFGQKNFWIKKIFESKKFWIKKIFMSKKFVVKKILVKKIRAGIFFWKKNWVGLTQGGGYLAPQPHPENSRVKFVCG